MTPLILSLLPLIHSGLIALLFHAVLAPAAALHALVYKRDSRAAFGWIALCFLLPVAGPVLYAVAGVNRVRSRAERHPLPAVVGYERGETPEAGAPAGDPPPADSRELARIGARLGRHPLVAGNAITPLHNGEAAYPAMLEAIDQARHRIYLTTYILDAGRIGQVFVDALARAANRGVDVRVLLDGIGECYSFPRASRRLRRAGVPCARFLPPRLLPPQLSINLRNHHKILAVDGIRAITGGMNIGDRHMAGNSGNPKRVVDVNFDLHGPVAMQLESEFLRTWQFATGRADKPRGPFPDYAPVADGDYHCRVITDGPDGDLDRLTMLLTATIARARRTIRIMTPYFLPPREIVGVLQAASLRGVDVALVLPEMNNLPFVHWATRNMLWELLFTGVRVYYQPPPFVHSKLFTVDGRYALVGSTNWDPRSLRLNFELQVEVFGTGFAERLDRHVDAAATRGRPVTLEEVDGRSLPVRLRDSACWLFSPYL